MYKWRIHVDFVNKETGHGQGRSVTVNAPSRYFAEAEGFGRLRAWFDEGWRLGMTLDRISVRKVAVRGPRAI